ncbi:MAG TPA: hypothetical protein VHU88_22535 [Sporichthyaceae bacterium]|jgi:hypothetical protein|nr:hypothetical protein [Sporichthyaceae bacterium]
MGGHGKLVRRATIGALVAGLCTPVAASAAISSAALPNDKSTVLHLSEKDANKTFNVTLRTRIVVDLHGSYDPPAVDHPEVLREGVHSGGYPTQSDATATFKAISLGNATISSRLDSDCMHPQPGHAGCMMMPAPLLINIVVDQGVLPPTVAPVPAPATPPGILTRLGLPITIPRGR